MIDFTWPWVFAVLPLPLLVRLLWPPAAEVPARALRLPFYREVVPEGRRHSGPRRRWRQFFAWLVWMLLLLAAARPQWLGEPVKLPVAGRDLMLAVDVSGSMEQRDYQLEGGAVTRLDVVKAVAGEFIEQRAGDRLGLVLFGTRAYLQTPLTFDRVTVRSMLDEAVIGLAGIETAVGDAIALGVKRLRLQPQDNRILILLTDGKNTTGKVDPQVAATLAALSNVRVYTIGIGGKGIEVRSPFGTLLKRGSELDTQTLQAVADKTGGRFFHATDSAQLEQVYAELNRLEPSVRDSRSLRPVRSLYMWPAGAALLLSMALALAAIARRRTAGTTEVTG